MSIHKEQREWRIALCNLIAILVAMNQPFYPLYVYFGVSGSIAPIFYTFLSTPLFAAVPFATRHHARSGRVLLVAAGIGNTILTAHVIGAESGVEVFYIPCALLGAVLFGPSERMFALLLTSLPFVLFFSFAGQYGNPVHIYTAEEYRAFRALNAASATMLTVVIGFSISGTFKQSPRPSLSDADHDKKSMRPPPG